jgi:plastocyanin
MTRTSHPIRRLTMAFLAAASVALVAMATVGLLNSTATADPVAHASASKGVRIVDFAFRPATLTIAAGTKVEFENEGSVAHTATRKNGFDSKRIPPGGSFSIRFKRAGSFAYHCKIHPEMKGKIVVQ